MGLLLQYCRDFASFWNFENPSMEAVMEVQSTPLNSPLTPTCLGWDTWEQVDVIKGVYFLGGEDCDITEKVD